MVPNNMCRCNAFNKWIGAGNFYKLHDTYYYYLKKISIFRFQFNFSDHMKIILCPRMGSVTYIDNDKRFRTYRFTTIGEVGITKELYQKLRYAHEKLQKLLEKLS